MSEINIRDAALIHFARNGYEGASLANIAEDVGIKKPSIYAHYKGKDDLFMSVANYACTSIRKRIVEYFVINQHLGLQVKLEGFFDWIQTEYETDETMKFLLRVMFFPPAKLEQEILGLLNPFVQDMQRILIRMLRNQVKKPEEVGIGYLTIVDGCMVELIYAGADPYQRRLQAILPIFWRGIQ
ncbi:TetR family transcriptional regulator [Paenibacillus albidus]|uniref:TetR family transcriptional regulator n=1 Tax=Paenibacillus albidus TaxID=2041023 RepID=A0A917CW26_9BACL|nr:TetR/AcrR family transcriptional regulator [Paenibacillus albidus]GGF97805.1 TetR family transcriptional regulator [Paenibacillus albidus]